MIGRDSNTEIDRYGLAPWIAGAALAAVIIYAMFGLAAGFA